MISVFEYLNYRDYLKDVFEYLRVNDQNFTLKLVQYELGASSNGFVPNVLAGRKNLTHAHIPKLSTFLKHKKNESRYFEALVYFTRSKTSEEKEGYFKTMISLKKLKFKTIDDSCLSLFSHWYYVFIRGALGIQPFYGNFAALGRKLIPAISEAQVRDAIDFLLAQGFIKKGGENGYTLTEPVITTGDEVTSMFLMSYHRTMLDNSKFALDHVAPEERDMSIVSLSLTDSAFAEVKSELQLLRKKIMKLAETCDSPDKMYTMNMQLFPVTKSLREE